MEVKLIISADNSAMRFAELLGGLFREGVVIESDKEKGVIVGTEPYSEWTTQDVKEDLQTAPADDPKIETIEDVVETCENWNEIRSQIKDEAIRVVKAKKREELKELNAKYGIHKVDELDNNSLDTYLAEVREI